MDEMIDNLLNWAANAKVEILIQLFEQMEGRTPLANEFGRFQLATEERRLYIQIEMVIFDDWNIGDLVTEFVDYELNISFVPARTPLKLTTLAL